MALPTPFQPVPHANDSAGVENERQSESEPLAQQEVVEEPFCNFQVVFFAVFEGFTCVWLLTVLLGFRPGADVALLPGLCGYCLHIFTQYALPDVGEVRQTLASLEGALEEPSARRVLSELRAARPRIEVLAEAYHTTTTGTRRSVTGAVVDHAEAGDFRFASWKDVSEHFAGLGSRRVLAVAVVPGFVFADAETQQSYSALKLRLEGTCRPHGRAVRSTCSTSLEHPAFPVTNRRILVVRAPGETNPWWLTVAMYDRARFVWPFLGSVYRLVVLASVKRVRYDLKKEVSISQRFGSLSAATGWGALGSGARLDD